MGAWGEIFYVMIAAFMGYMLYRSMKNNPELYSSENMNKSASTMGLLALVLIVFVGVCIVIIRTA